MGSTVRLMAGRQLSACCSCGKWGGWEEALFLIHKKMPFSLVGPCSTQRLSVGSPQSLVACFLAWTHFFCD